MTANGSTPAVTLGQTLGDALRQARKAAGLTQEELADRMGPPTIQQYVARWETGDRRFGLEHVMAAERALALPVGALLRAAGVVAEVGDTRERLAADPALAEPWRSMVVAAYDLAAERSR